MHRVRALQLREEVAGGAERGGRAATVQLVAQGAAETAAEALRTADGEIPGKPVGNEEQELRGPSGEASREGWKFAPRSED